MLTYHEACEQLEALTHRMSGGLVTIPGSGQAATLAHLKQDLAANLFTVVVVGEFKRGKSTLLNGLVGQELLPVDVTPTTATINVLRYSDTPLLRVHRPDGSFEDSDLTTSRLREFVADPDFDPTTVSYLEIGLPHPLFAHGMVYVDTPGVSDLNQQRGAVTCQFVPRADAVLFLLDATSPVRRSEQDFLETAILRSGIERLIFLVNFADMVDEEERERLAALVERRLQPALGNRNYPVYLISARQALEATIEGSADNFQASGLAEVSSLLHDLQACGPSSTEKLRRFIHRTEGAARAMEREVEYAGQLATASDEELQEQLSTLDALVGKSEQRREAIGEWVRDRENELLAMTRKSLDHFATSLRDHVCDDVASYKGADFKDYVENRITKLIRGSCKGWVDMHADAITTVLTQLDRQIALALGRAFQTALPTTGAPRARRAVPSDASVSLRADDVSNSTLIAGLVTGGAAALVMAVGGPLFMPLVSMVGFPLLTRTLTESKLAEAKSKLLPELNRVLDQVLDGFMSDTLELIHEDIGALQRAAEKRYDELMSVAVQQIRREVEQRTKDRTTIAEARAQLDGTNGMLKEVCATLQQMLYDSIGSAERAA